MKKTFVLDTNVLIHDPWAIFKFEENDVVIPIIVVEEIDKFKRDQSEIGRNARMVSRFLDDERKKGNLHDGVPLNHGGCLRIALESQDLNLGMPIFGNSKSNDNWILGVAIHISKQSKDSCILVTKDTNLRIKADAVGITAQDYFNDKVEVDELYTGFEPMTVTSDQLDQLIQTGALTAPEGAYPNKFFGLHTAETPEDFTLVRVDPEKGSLVRINTERNAWGITPLNFEQTLALELLLDPRVKLVSLIGKAGTGKTLMAIASGLQQVVEENTYNRLMVGRPIHPLGKDIGYLPGDIDEKIRPWMQPIFDNLEYILHENTDDQFKKNVTYDYFIDKGWLLVEPLTYMRGRSIPNQYLLVDEAQNLTPHEIKSIITRAGHRTKVVLTGDPHQIDNPFLDATTNGISYLVERMKGQSLFGHVTLTRGERSELAECASNLL